MRNYRIFFVCVLIAVVVSMQGCAEKQSPTPLASPLSQPEPFNSVVHTPTTMPRTALPTAVSGQAVVAGRILDSQTQQAPLEGIIYLAQTLSLDTGDPVVRLDQQEDLLSVPDQGGYFVFPQVEPGDYALVLHTPEITFLIEKQDGTNVLFSVETGQVMDLGTIGVLMP
jgi:hypothetical protein